MYEALKTYLKGMRDLVLPHRCKTLYMFFGIALALCFIYYIIIAYILKTSQKNDIMNRTVFTLNGKAYSWWPISHFILFYIIGFLFPSCTIMAILAGILWEIVELVFGAIQRANIPQEGDAMSSHDGTIQYKVWWTASSMDIVLNILGFFLGKMTRIEFDSLTGGEYAMGGRCS